jgi:hypothetical protein
VVGSCGREKIMNDIFLKFESEVMLNLLSETNEFSEQLKLQYLNSKVKERKFTGYGFFTEFTVDSKFKLPNTEKMTFGNLQADINDLKYGVGFVLFVNNGLIDFLECYTYDEKFPTEIINYNLHIDY